MNKKGFTLIEVLSVLVIIAILGGLAIVGTRTFFKTTEERYYEAIESNLLLAGNDYFTDHRELLPNDDNYSMVELSFLVSSKYIEPIKDTNGEVCNNGIVYVYRENNQYAYQACIIDCGGYTTKGGYCSEVNAKTIEVSARKTGTNQSYDVTKSYSKTAYSDGKDIDVTMNMNSKYQVALYRIYVANDNSFLEECTSLSGNSCTTTITKSGTYKIAALDAKNKVIATKYINIRIDKNGSKFTLAGAGKYTISSTQCNNNEKVKVTVNIVKEVFKEEYKSIEYKIDDGEYIEANSTTIQMELASGHHTIEVAVTNYVNNVHKETKDIDVIYNVNLLYSDNTTEKHEVVKGFSYDYLKELPKKKSAYGLENLDISWYKNDVKMSGDTTVEEECPHEIEGRMAVPIPVQDFATYCNSLTYNGEEQTLTKTAPDNIIFIQNKGTNAGEYTVKARINSPQYIWQDGNNFSYDDIEFVCLIGRVEGTFSCDDKTYDGSQQSACMCSGGELSGITSAIDAGNNTAYCTPDENHTLDGGIVKVSRTWTMNPKQIGNCQSGKIYTYTGGNINSSVSCPTGATIGGTTSATGTGVKTVTCTGTGNYTGTCTINWKICDFTRGDLCYEYQGYGNSTHWGSGWDCMVSPNTLWNTEHCTKIFGSASRAKGYIKVGRDSGGDKYACKCYHTI